MSFEDKYTPSHYSVLWGFLPVQSAVLTLVLLEHMNIPGIIASRIAQARALENETAENTVPVDPAPEPAPTPVPDPDPIPDPVPDPDPIPDPPPPPPLPHKEIVGTNQQDTLHGDEDYVNTVHGLKKADTLYASDNGDTLYGDQGRDILYGGDGNDTLYGGSNEDILYGGDGDDYLSGDHGRDELYGGAGNDTLLFANSNVLQDGGEGFDILVMDSLVNIDLGNKDVSNMEQISLANPDKSMKLKLSIEDVIGATDLDNVLFIDGDVGDKVQTKDDWTATSQVTVDSTTYTGYTGEDATLYIDDDLTLVGF